MSKELETIINKYTKENTIVAFSGGVDSSLVLKIACCSAKNNNKKVYAIIMKTFLHPIIEINEAVELAKKEGAIPIVIEVNELTHSEIKNNHKERCYLCKKYLFTLLREKAIELDINYILEGTNISDTKEYRPGIKALKELDIKSPLMEANLEKSDIREIARRYNMEVSEKPSTPCLATRFPYGTSLEIEKIEKVASAEKIIKELGDFKNIRVRVHEDIARIEVDEENLTRVIKYKCGIIRELKKLGYRYITLDLEGFRSGSMD